MGVYMEILLVLVCTRRSNTSSDYRSALDHFPKQSLEIGHTLAAERLQLSLVKRCDWLRELAVEPASFTRNARGNYTPVSGVTLTPWSALSVGYCCSSRAAIVSISARA